MSGAQGGRQEWEYARGPAVGHDVPITSPPREEEDPGVLREPETAAPTSQNRSTEQRNGGSSATEEREVKAEDPGLSPETNQERVPPLAP